ncbi:DNA-methyltransferase [Legionella sp. CNM-1927-20]|uniref:DNA-methyltransferase n=1 Tax=Legionella sp. CNM-1927-20 TaxID=3422221 RepID=UPI00403B0B49
MAHLSEHSSPLQIIKKGDGLEYPSHEGPNVEFIYLPYYNNLNEISNKESLYMALNDLLAHTNEQSIIAVLTSSFFAVDFLSQLPEKIHLKLWISIKLSNAERVLTSFDQSNAALIILSKHDKALIHTKTRISYTYCPACDKTTKDYGGKKHLYHQYGTLMSDVWRDISIDFEKEPEQIINRLSDLFGLEEFNAINYFDWRLNYPKNNAKPKYKQYKNLKVETLEFDSLLLNMDCLESLQSLPSNSIDFCFADPPYNIQKKYENWNDGIDIIDYFEWCDKWLCELARVLKPGCTLAILNIPQWCVRHYKYLSSILDFQDWIVWEGLSLPVRMIMPAHYSILCFSKGAPRNQPGFLRKNHSPIELDALTTVKENYCNRPSCIKRRRQEIDDTQTATNIWWDIHRLKHNSRRVDHPCQLPPALMRRLISFFTNENEIVLDPFNGAGTTTLTSAQLHRRFIGIELSEYYHQIALNRHQELVQGIDPFRKNDGTPKAKNSRVERLEKQAYKVSKKVLQLEIKQICEKIGHIPSREEVLEYSSYPIEYFDNYFINWGEVTAAARTTGMKEDKFENKYLNIELSET